MRSINSGRLNATTKASFPNSQAVVPKTKSMPLLATDHSNCNVPYSFMDTETELQHSAFQRASSPANSMIDESPISPSAGLPNSGHQIKRSRIASEEAPLPQPEVSLGFEPSIEMHPARYAPYAEPMHGAEIPRLMNEKQLQEPTTINTGQQPLSSAAPTNTSPFAQRKIESLGLSPDTIQRNIAYSPDSLAGPNLGHVNHQPGQVSHPNATVEPEWRHGLYGVDTLCCTGLVCPCIVYGKTQYRLSRKAQKQDPTDLLGYESCNGSCGIMAAACGLQCENLQCGKAAMANDFRDIYYYSTSQDP